MYEIAMKMLLCLLLATMLGAIIGYIIGRMKKCEEKRVDVDDDLNFSSRVDEFTTSTIASTPAMLTSQKEEVEANVVEDDILQTIVKEESGLISTTDEDKPELLDAPRGGKADDLKEISGIGIKIEETLNKLGIFHFDQIANWTKENVEWVNEHLLVFKGRIEREKWVEQAKKLASGEETDFSKRVKNGEIDRY